MFSIFKKNNFTSVSVHDLDDKLGKVNLIDIREPYEYKSGHIPTAKNVPMETILIHPEKYMNKDKEYYVVCQSGGRSSRACRELSNKGYKVVNISGGTGSYIKPLSR
ncbi:rhodanese-like domain-containing protein [Clostridium felsineum]|uniref:Thiosulfate sulfurtransferase GlpE n=1 Tax=Clostridium felsineum TaxID=36839 RepID=A0A1S8LZ11_9CLOT|nr:rhodanese-like domain-containing protein [Clostridium felsineum]MCR3760702.1 rhodanese-like domain-containing protein [Clostridium felsineum]URZ09103.1 Thiosulfate sulfurtransferase GlpE [Clostridium felsineum]URZ13790.1 Thiosulfate sulfurtransferase GlpE [Clostridium felsineum]URZ18691.1 Thiosulfate sulfurtransferase GlpE [Clostridium felsineum DSM 794]